MLLDMARIDQTKPKLGIIILYNCNAPDTGRVSPADWDDPTPWLGSSHV